MYYDLEKCYLGKIRVSQEFQKVYEHFPDLFGRFRKLELSDFRLTQGRVFLGRLSEGTPYI